jgi:FkbM family methyltransferase
VEKIKVILRKFIPRSIYRLFAKPINVLIVLFTNPSCIWPLFLSSNPRNQIKPAGILHPFWFRNIHYDRNVVVQNLIRHECLPVGLKPGFVVDAGGYIGDSAALYLSQWPNCKCLVLEPSSNHEMAAENLAPYGDRAMLFRAFLGREPGFGCVEEAAVGSRMANCSGDIPIMSMEQILALAPEGRIDVLKVDIEGAELDLLRPPISWIDRVQMIVIELHGSEAEVSVRKWMCDYGFDCEKKRSLHFFVRSGSVSHFLPINGFFAVFVATIC